jgi:Fic family protein
MSNCMMIPFLKERLKEFNVTDFVDELTDAAMQLGCLCARLDSCRFIGAIISMFYGKETVASLYIEGTQTTISGVLENNLTEKPVETQVRKEFERHLSAFIFGESYLGIKPFSHEFIKRFHTILLSGFKEKPGEDIGYRKQDNRIVNSFGKVVFEPPSHTETKKYMDELIGFMNNRNDGVNPFIKAAILHAQFESIHPFEDGNGRVGRALVGLYFYKSGLINFPYFYLSEAISRNKAVYYAKLDSTRNSDYNEWIRFFLRMVSIQAKRQIHYMDAVETLYEKTRTELKGVVNSPKFEAIIQTLFEQPVLTSRALSTRLDVTVGQAKRYLEALEERHILSGGDRKRNRLYYFTGLIDALHLY